MGKVLVTGGAGFIGASVVRTLLQRGRSVRVLLEPGGSRKAIEGLDVEIVEGSILDRGAMDRALDGCDALYHLAAIYKLWMPDATKLWDVNVEGTTNVMLAARAANVRKIVYTSSVVAIGIASDGQIADEDTPFNTYSMAGDYILSKYVAERVVRRMADDGLPVVIVSPSLPFGVGDFAPTPTGKLVLSVLRGEVPAIAPGGISVADVDVMAQGHVLAEEKGIVGEKYILTDHNITSEQFVRTICEVAGRAPPKLRVPAAVASAIGWGFEAWANHVSHNEPPSTHKAIKWSLANAWYSPDKARRVLGLPTVPLQQTIARSVAFFREQQMV